MFDRLSKISGPRRYWKILSGDYKRRLGEKFTDLQKRVHIFTLHISSSAASAIRKIGQSIDHDMHVKEDLAARSTPAAGGDSHIGHSTAQATPAQSRPPQPLAMSYQFMDLSGELSFIRSAYTAIQADHIQRGAERVSGQRDRRQRHRQRGKLHRRKSDYR